MGGVSNPSHPPDYRAGGASQGCGKNEVMDRTKEVHEPSGECHGQHCYSHNLDESGYGDRFKICFECNHVFRTEEELIEAYREAVEEFFPGRSQESIKLEDIFFCPHCHHDF